MRIIRYQTEDANNLYDFDTIRKVLNKSRSKLHREIIKNNIKGVKYKNQYLYSEQTLFDFMEEELINRLDKYDR
jgi:hypothetical protein